MVRLTLTDRQNQPNEPKRVLLIKLILTYTVIIQIYAHLGTPSVSFSVALTVVMNFRALVGFTHGYMCKHGSWDPTYWPFCHHYILLLLAHVFLSRRRVEEVI